MQLPPERCVYKGFYFLPCKLGLPYVPGPGTQSLDTPRPHFWEEEGDRLSRNRTDSINKVNRTVNIEIRTQSYIDCLIVIINEPCSID